MRINWTDLPEAVTEEIAERVGVFHVVAAKSGNHAEIAAMVDGAEATVFVKAAKSELEVRLLQYELLVGKAITWSFAPAVEWTFEAAGWLVVGFEHCPGPHADLSPGSPHLDLLAETLDALGETPAPPGPPWFSPAGRLGFAHPAMAGNTLIHTDLNPANLIITPNGLRLIDWAFATKGAPWVELAMLAQWLIGSGHTAEQAERWLSGSPTWRTASPAVLDHFAAANAAKWSHKAGNNAASWVQDLAEWNRKWAAFRQR
ncbi:phosphotransferase [Actinoplanes sp. NPDC051859]|uniref:phosphotransferase n=1 Tax=Actinoplanes sp. NPDC051859 TaxID=3363909 RepID=UPI0037A32012